MWVAHGFVTDGGHCQLDAAMLNALGVDKEQWPACALGSGGVTMLTQLAGSVAASATRHFMLPPSSWE